MAIWDGSCAFIIPLVSRCWPTGIGGRSGDGGHGFLDHDVPPRVADASWDNAPLGGVSSAAASVLPTI